MIMLHVAMFDVVSSTVQPITTQLQPRLHCDGAMMKEAFVDICLRRLQVTLSGYGMR